MELTGIKVANVMHMPEKKTIKRARRAKRQGKASTTQAGEFVREEIHHVREGKHGARSTKQAIAIGLSKARRAGVKLPRPKRASARTRKSAASASRAGRRKPTTRPQSTRRARAIRRALKREPRSTASRRALSAQARRAARQRQHQHVRPIGVGGELLRQPLTGLGSILKQHRRPPSLLS